MITLTLRILAKKKWMIFWWFLALFGTALVTMIFYPEFKGSNISSLFNSLPATVQHIVGNASSYDSLNGYISQEIFGLRAPLLVIILSIIVFNSITISEERKGILETQVSLPITRSKLILSKIIGGSLVVILASVGLLVGTEVGLILIHDHYSLIKLFELIADSVLISLVFGLVLVALYSLLSTRSIVLGLTCAYIFIGYLLTSLAVTAHNLSSIEKLSLFHYYSYATIFSTKDFLILLYAALALILISYIAFVRRDIQT